VAHFTAESQAGQGLLAIFMVFYQVRKTAKRRWAVGYGWKRLGEHLSSLQCDVQR